MKLKVLLPAEIFLTEEVTKVVAEAENGFFCLMSSMWISRRPWSRVFSPSPPRTVRITTAPWTSAPW